MNKKKLRWLYGLGALIVIVLAASFIIKAVNGHQKSNTSSSSAKVEQTSSKKKTSNSSTSSVSSSSSSQVQATSSTNQQTSSSAQSSSSTQPAVGTVTTRPQGAWVTTFEHNLYNGYKVTPNYYKYYGNGLWEVWVNEINTNDYPYVTVNQYTGNFHG
ncbi:hypothetical protein [Levilactobacillus brevis]|nr:hypothetical protein [Levilactobacillus brevis]